MGQYSEGQMTFTQGSQRIVLVGGDLNAAGIALGMLVSRHESGLPYYIGAIVSATEADLTGNYLGVSETADYFISLDKTPSGFNKPSPNDRDAALVTAVGMDQLDLAIQAKSNSDHNHDGVYAVYDDLAMPSLVRNGGFQVAQRGTSFESTLAYTVGLDGWRGYLGSGYRIEQIAVDHAAANAPRSGFAARRTRLSGSTTTSGFSFEHGFTTSECVAMRGQQITVSGKVRRGSGFTQPFWPQLITGTGVARTHNFSAYTNQASPVPGASVSMPDPDVWYDWEFTGTVATDIGQATLFLPYYPTGTAAANETLDITDIKVEASSVRTPFVPRDYDQDEWDCLPFFWKSHDRGVYPGTVVSINSGQMINTAHVAGSMGVTIPYGRAMYSTPVVTLYDHLGVAGGVSYFNGTWNGSGAYSVLGVAQKQTYLQSNIGGAIQTVAALTAAVDL